MYTCSTNPANTYSIFCQTGGEEGKGDLICLCPRTEFTVVFKILETPVQKADENSDQSDSLAVGHVHICFTLLNTLHPLFEQCCKV